MKKILVLGYFGYITNQLDGQTVKTREIYKLLKNNSNSTCKYIDTQSYSQNKILFFKTLFEIVKTDYLIYLPGKKNLLYLFPLIFLFSKISKTQIIYPIVGGWLSDYINTHKFLNILLKRIKILLSESNSLKKQLENNYNLKNVEWFPNFRIGSFHLKEKINSDSKTFKILYMGRIIKEKGVDSIFELSKKLNVCNDIEYQIDFYGPILYDNFQNLLNESSNVLYKGILEGDEIYNTLVHYDLMLLPTYYQGEGFPGSIIDAYLAGVPVICSKWKFLPELVIDGETGYVFDLKEPTALFNYVRKISVSKELHNKLRLGAYNMGQNFTEEAAWDILKNHIN